MHYVARNFLAGRSFRDYLEANDKVLLWCFETAGLRVHGTIKEEPLKRFDEVERRALLPLPAAPYALAIWNKAKLHPDCHIVFEGSRARSIRHRPRSPLPMLRVGPTSTRRSRAATASSAMSATSTLAASVRWIDGTSGPAPPAVPQSDRHADSSARRIAGTTPIDG